MARTWKRRTGARSCSSTCAGARAGARNPTGCWPRSTRSTRNTSPSSSARCTPIAAGRRRVRLAGAGLRATRPRPAPIALQPGPRAPADGPALARADEENRLRSLPRRRPCRRPRSGHSGVHEHLHQVRHPAPLDVGVAREVGALREQDRLHAIRVAHELPPRGEKRREKPRHMRRRHARAAHLDVEVACGRPCLGHSWRAERISRRAPQGPASCARRPSARATRSRRRRRCAGWSCGWSRRR